METLSSLPHFLQRYYRRHAHVYDATRWSFLFGRKRLLRLLPQQPGLYAAEVGCGTGYNLKRLARSYPDWRLVGIDMSRHMLDRAFKGLKPYIRRVFLLQKVYGKGQFRLKEPVDIVLFSYSLSMFNPGCEGAIEQAYDDLKPGGHIAVVDFHDTASHWFRRWMGLHHVRMEGHLLPLLEERFEIKTLEVRRAYGGLWRYFLFVGQKRVVS